MENNKDLNSMLNEIKENSERLSKISFSEFFGIPDLTDASLDYRYEIATNISKNFKRNENLDLHTGAFILEVLGFDDLAYSLRKFVNLKFSLADNEKMISELVIAQEFSKKQREKASKPRSKYYEEVNSVITATWKKYPCASQTGLHNALINHYYEKVSPNTLLSWIKTSEAKPKKPKKYTRFELIFPQ